MSLRYAILGLLARERLTGYDLTKRFDTSIGFFWSAKHSQIYPELAALTKENMVTFEVVTQTSKPNKKVYTITDEGRSELARWVAEPADKRTVKDPLMLRTWAIGAVDPTLGLEHLKASLAEAEKRCVYFAQLETEVRQATEGHEDEWHGAFLALRMGTTQASMYRDWLRWAVAELTQAKSSAAAAKA
ncbi:Transcriptional regulator PadR-like family protein [compost metagenome]